MRINLIILLILTSFISYAQETPDSNDAADVNAILGARHQSNSAIAEKDTLHIADAWMNNFLIITSTDAVVSGKEENRKSFTRSFKERPDVIYVRTSNEIKVMKEWNMASETGTWEGSWTGNEGKIEIGGTYYAKWHKVKDKWLLRAEVFTPTRCKGGDYCKTQPINK